MALEGLMAVRARVCRRVCVRARGTGEHKEQRGSREESGGTFPRPELYFKKILKPESETVPLDKGQGRLPCRREERVRDRGWWEDQVAQWHCTVLRWMRSRARFPKGRNAQCRECAPAPILARRNVLCRGNVKRTLAGAETTLDGAWRPWQHRRPRAAVRLQANRTPV